MDKLTYLAELAEGLARWVPERERQDILRYYAEYFEEAGPGREAEVVAELGDPWALSCRLAVEGGFVTQEAADSWTPRQNRRKMWPLVAVAAVACVAIVAVSVARTAASVGGWIGRLVGSQTAVVDSVEEGTGFATIKGDPGVEYIEGVEFIGGFWSVKDGCLDLFDAIDVEIGLGNVTITGGDDYTLSVQCPRNLGGYAVEWEIKGGTLEIRDNGGKHNLEGLSGLGALTGSEPVDVIITVPDGHVLSKLEVQAGLGNVFLSQLEVDANLEAETGLGNVECYEVSTWSKIKLMSGLGDITVGLGDQIYPEMELDLETGKGNVEVQASCYERDCVYDLETGVGNVMVNGQARGTKASRSGGDACKLKAESGLGDINVFFEEDWQ